jgi:hypothetical protein
MISADTRARVREAFGRRCGYCGVPEILIGGVLELDHFHPISRGGADDESNLIYACTTCNRFKADYWPEEGAPEGLRLLRPRLDRFDEHIVEAANGRLAGRTPRGWFHIRWLHLNRHQLVELRMLAGSGRRVAQALEEALADKARLQRRIVELEKEVAALQSRIKRLV